MKISTLALAVALAASFGLTSMAFAQTNSATPATPAAAAAGAKTEKSAHKPVQHKSRTDKSSADAKAGAGAAVKK